MKRFFLGLLALSMLPVISCGDAALGTDTTVATVTDSSADTVTETAVSDDLGKFDFGGEEFSIYTRVTPLFYPYLDVTEETGDVLNDAVYVRNRRIEERFNFVFKEYYYDYTVEGNDAPRKFLLAGDDTYDMFVGRNVHMFNYASEGMFYKIEDLPHIDPDKSYWNQQLYSDLSMYGEHFFAIGAFNVSAYDFTHVMLFNKDMLTKYGLDDPYKLVRDGKWTFDQFGQMARAAVSDVNGDSVMDENDQYGYTSIGKQVLPGFWIAADTVSVEKDSDGKLIYTAMKDQKFIEVYQKIFTITWDDNIWHRVPSSVDKEEELELFCEGHALFTNSSCYQISTIRDTDVDFGILPYPKYDENQTEYYSRIEGCELFGVPLSNSDPDRASVILEAMASESLDTVLPAYYDVALKVKFTRDEASSEMLDIVFKNRVFDYGDTILCTEFRDGVLRGAFIADNRNAASLLTTVESTMNSKIKTLNDAFAQLAAD